jgi:hypothetical protein
MGLTLTQLASDNFQRANVNPLTSPWALDEYGDTGLEIVSEICQPPATFTDCAQLYEYAGGTPNDCYASVTIQAGPGGTAFGYIGVRLTDNGSEFFNLPGYTVQIIEGNFYWIYAGATLIANGSLAVSSGDVVVLAVIGNTLYLLHNGSLITSLTNSSYASGLTALAAYAENPVSFSNFAMGSAAITYTVSGNAGAPSATVSYSGTASGSVTSDGSGNYTLNLPNGSYTITPSKSGRLFNPTSKNVTVSGANLMGVNFTDGVAGSGDGIQVEILVQSDYPLGAIITLSTSVANSLIARGIATAL